jgi:hypothetical protein
MIIWVGVDFKQLLQLGKKYHWQHPSSCPVCSGRVWGHGFVWRYFAAAADGCWIKRYRCPDCGQVHTLRPEGYWPRCWQGQEETRRSLEERLATGSWPRGMPRQRGGHWLRGLRRQVKKWLGFEEKIFPDGFEELVMQRIVPVSRSKTGVIIPQCC